MTPDGPIRSMTVNDIPEFAYAWPGWLRSAEMNVAKLVHHTLPQPWTPFVEPATTDRVMIGCERVPDAPSRQLGEKRDELDRRFR